MRSVITDAKVRHSRRPWPSNTGQSFAMPERFRRRGPLRWRRSRCRCAVFCFASSPTKF